MLGKLHNAYNIDIEGYTGDNNSLIHHEVIELPNNNLLATLHEPNSKYIEDHIVEIDRETGETTQEINLRDVMPEDAQDDYDAKNADKIDWIHHNELWFDESDESMLVSARIYDVIIKISYPDGQLEGIIGADEKWKVDYNIYLLVPKGDVKFTAGQHEMMIVDNPEFVDQPKLKDIILFDNNEVFIRGDR